MQLWQRYKIYNHSDYSFAANSGVLDTAECEVAIGYDHETYGVFSLYTTFVNLALC